MVASVLDSGLLDKIITMADGFDGFFDRDRVRAEIDVLTAEFAQSGLACPTALLTHTTVMRGLLVPLADSELSCALSRLWAVTTYADDVASHDRAEAEALLQAVMLADRPVRSPIVGALRHATDELGRFCDPLFLAIHKSFVCRSAVGVLMEAEFTPTVSDEVDTEYVRALTGFAEPWALSLQFVDPCLRVATNWGFWVAALSPMVTFINGLNDVLSFYKEAIDGTDFQGSRVYRRAVREGVPYLDSYRETLDAGLAAHQQILRLATDEQRPHLDRYLTGYLHWHLRSPRYRLQDLRPSLTPIDPTR
ncbi:hypothetical protein [Kitasatospora sp. NPDC094011]|uniref:hypothetical protein n=1 Tax=Kitasatospora sp. NPDC094011 TaxID=3364090 RepID=UPI00381D11AD